MTSVTKLFFHRLYHEWKYQLSVWRTVVDWTVALYLVIPTLGYAIKTYFDWWKVQPAWISHIPFTYFAVIPLIVILRGDVRVFVEEADQLFLFQLDGWIKRLRKLSIVYSISLNFAINCLLFSYLAPIFLLYYKLPLIKLIIWCFSCFVLKTIVGLSKQVIYLHFYGWRQGLARLLTFLLIGGYYRVSLFFLNSIISSIFAILILLILPIAIPLYQEISKNTSFLKDVARAQTMKLRYVSLIMRAAFIYKRKSRPLTINKRPWIFQRSKPLFKERNAANLLTEACLKSVIRSETHLVTYGQLIVLCIAVIWSFPLDWKWALWLGFAVMLTKFVELFWQETKNSEFVKLFPWTTGDYSKAASKAIPLVMLIGFLPISFAFGILSYSWSGAVTLLIVGGVVGYFIAKVVVALS
ncbi:bacterial ABC transporter protein EcsB [Peptococcaceae bacterium CEB3]|nr:bacterial ABC transporter protein EcsB [Peptococcaceae bacterium CEB3]